MKFLALMFYLVISMNVFAAPIVLEESTVSEKDRVKSNNLRDSIKPPSTFIDDLAKPAPPSRRADPLRTGDLVASCGSMRLEKIDPARPGGNEWYRYRCSDCTSIVITKGFFGSWGPVGSVSPRGNPSVKSSLDEAARSSCGD